MVYKDNIKTHSRYIKLGDSTFARTSNDKQESQLLLIGMVVMSLYVLISHVVGIL